MTTLDRLIDQFVDAQQDGNCARWRQVDLAAAVYAEAGSRGLAQLAQACGFTHSYLRTFVRMSAVFPPGTRRIALSYAHHAMALRAINRFPADSPEHDPRYWLDQSTVHGYTVQQLQDALLYHTLATDSLATRQAHAAHKVAEAQRARDRLAALMDTFNTEYAVFWGARLVLTEQALLHSAS